MNTFTKLAIAAALMAFAAMAQTTGENPTDNEVTWDSPQVSDYTGGYKVGYNDPLYNGTDPMKMWGGANVQGPADDLDNTALSPSLEDLIDSVDDIVDDIDH